MSYHPADPWMTVREAAAYSRSHLVTIRRALESGRLKGHQQRAGCSWLIRVSEVDRWIEGRAA